MPHPGAGELDKKIAGVAGIRSLKKCSGGLPGGDAASWS